MEKNAIEQAASPGIRNGITAQGEDGYRYSIEPFLLADFTRPRPGGSVLDVGSGCGIIPLLLLKRHPGLTLTGVEIQPELHAWAVRNIREAGAEKQIELIEGDIAALTPTWKRESFDAIVSNPPYRKQGTGRINPDRGKAIARHELTLDLKSLVAASALLLKPGGSLTLAYPPARLAEVLAVLEGHGLFIHRLRFIHGHSGADASIFLVEAVKAQKTDCRVEQPLTVYNPDRSYTREMEEIYASLDHPDGADHDGKKRYRPRAG
ncbi:MAG: methyltransferase [Nitrospinaceae bacterium]|nr:MAG: methyltransferase [Nitrospinaceae bacterium]